MPVAMPLRPNSAKSIAPSRRGQNPGIYRWARLELEIGRTITPELTFP